MHTSEKTEAIEQEKGIRLSFTDTAWFFDVLENPPKPNAKLLQAVSNYRQGLR